MGKDEFIITADQRLNEKELALVIVEDLGVSIAREIKENMDNNTNVMISGSL